MIIYAGGVNFPILKSLWVPRGGFESQIHSQMYSQKTLLDTLDRLPGKLLNAPPNTLPDNPRERFGLFLKILRGDPLKPPFPPAPSGGSYRRSSLFSFL